MDDVFYESILRTLHNYIWMIEEENKELREENISLSNKLKENANK